MNEDKFTKKSCIYDKYRPNYPASLIEYLYTKEGFNEKSKIADVGAGTGIFSEQLLKQGSQVILVEPNDGMLEEARKKLCNYKNAYFLSSSAEKIELSSHSLDYITVAQAFHWFNLKKFKSECKRLLVDDGKVLLTWNITDSESKVIQDLAYLNKLYLGSCYNTRDKEDLKYYLKFFKEYILNYFDNDLELNIDQFIGRCLSRSYSPSENDDIYDEYIDGLNSIFYDNSKEGKIIIKNKTRSMIGMVK